MFLFYRNKDELHKIYTGLDGLRAASVTLVLISHCGFGDIVPGGLGVTIFFFLSGYLITTLLINEFDRNQAIHVPHFYARRFLRLFPPLIVSLIIAYALLFGGLLEGGFSLVGLLSQLFYMANYSQLFDGATYRPERISCGHSRWKSIFI